MDAATNNCAEIRTWKSWQFGAFSATMQPSNTNGSMSSFFLYGGTFGTQSHNEIDFSFVGGTNRAHTNYVIAGVSHPLDVDMAAFGISAWAPHNYTINWTPTELRWPVVNDAGQWITLRHETAALAAPLRLMLNAWHGDNSEAAQSLVGYYNQENGAARISSVWIGQPQAAPGTPTATPTSIIVSPTPVAAPISKPTTVTRASPTSAPVVSVPAGSFIAPVTSTTSVARLFSDPYGAAAVAAGAQTNPQAKLLLQKVASKSMSLWLGNWNGNVNADTSAYISRATKDNSIGVLTLYNIPNRDCGSYSAGGSSPQAYPGWVQQIASGIGRARAIVVIEPDALSQIDQTNCLSDAAKAERYSLLQGALMTLKTYAPNATVYLDAGNPAWITPETMATNLMKAGLAQADGFALNVSNFINTVTNISYGNAISSLTGGKHFVIDASRNGAGPTADLAWCNPLGRALGEAPSLVSSGALDAYLWIKRPGESDGTCNGGPSAGSFWEQYAIDLAAKAAW